MIPRIMTFILVLLSQFSYAQTALPARYFYPSQGFWVSTSVPQERNSYAIQVGQDGYVFVSVYTYDNAGLPTFLTLQGQLQPASVEQRATGLMSSFSSPVYRTTGGTPFGTTLPANPQTTISEFGTAQIRFFIGERGDFTFNGQTLVIKPFALYTSPTDFQPSNIARGVWSFGQVANMNGQTGRFGMYTVTVNNQPTTTYSPSSPTAGPAPGSVQYRFSCVACAIVSSGGVLDFAATNNTISRVGSLLLTYDPALDQWRLYGISQTNMTYSFSGYAHVEYDSIVAFFRSGDELAFMSRLPDNFSFGGTQ